VRTGSGFGSAFGFASGCGKAGRAVSGAVTGLGGKLGLGGWVGFGAATAGFGGVSGHPLAPEQAASLVPGGQRAALIALLFFAPANE